MSKWFWPDKHAMGDSRKTNGCEESAAIIVFPPTGQEPCVFTSRATFAIQHLFQILEYKGIKRSVQEKKKKKREQISTNKKQVQCCPWEESTDNS